jgi:8-oxo-dGTP pyrophosphatase MutT (NUDIX family)
MHPLYRHITACNRFDPGLYQPFILAGRRLGYLHEKIQQSLLAGNFIQPQDGCFVLKAEPATQEARSAALQKILHHLIADKLVARERFEPYSVADAFEEEPVALADRALMPALGFKAVGIHCNGYIRDKARLRLWIGRRSADSTTDPGKLDHICAGGQPHGLTLEENLAKEAWEEAGIPKPLTAKATRHGHITYNLGMPHGIRRDTLFLFDLELPADFTPVNQDGEAQDFRLMDADEIKENLLTRDDFKFNVPLVLIDFLIRHGVLGKDEAGLDGLIKGLQAPQQI